MKVTPLDLRQYKFRAAVRGFDRAEVTALLTETADDYEQVLRESDQLREALSRSEELLKEHREREVDLRNTLMTAQKLADDVRANAKQDAKVIVREAQSRADAIVRKAQGRVGDIEREITQLQLRRRDAESTVESSISALGHALEFIRSQDKGPCRRRVDPARCGRRLTPTIRSRSRNARRSRRPSAPAAASGPSGCG